MGAAGDLILELRERNIKLTDPEAQVIAEDYKRIEEKQGQYQSYTGYSPTTKAEQRSNNQYSRYHDNFKQSPLGQVVAPKKSPLGATVHTPVPDSSPSVSYMNKLGQPISAPESIPTAWDTIRTKYNEGNWFTKLYDKVDYAMFGYLPSGLTPDLVKGADQETKAKRRRTTTQSAEILAEANEGQAKADTVLDYSDKKWYEDLFGSGFMYPQAERDYQSNQDTIRETTIIREQIANSNIPQSVFQAPGSSGSFFDGFKENIGAIAVLGIGAVILISGMKK